MSRFRRNMPIWLAALLCATLGFFAIWSFAGGEKQAGAYTSANTPTSNELGEITLSDYDTRTDGLAFDGKKLNQLFGKLVQAATGTPTASADIAAAKARVGNSTSSVTGTASTGNTITQSQALDFKTMQTQLGSPITLQFGGYSWTVVYATTNTTADEHTSAGDLIVTLWMNDNIKTASKWSAATASTDMSGNYPTNMYSSSYIRIATLNAGGDDGQRAGNSTTDGTTYYSTTISSRASSLSLNDRKNNEFAKFTLSESVLGKESLAGFLTMPKSVEYQRAENWVWSYGGTGNPYLLPNEAWGKDSNGPDTSLRHTLGSKTGGWYTSTPSNMSLMPGKPAYFEWIEDYLWLPSLTETGYYTSNTNLGASLWGIPQSDNILKSTLPSGTSTDVSWLRSGRYHNASNSNSLASAGAYVTPAVSEVGGVRPALHLNLSSAALSAAVEVDEPPTSVTKEYNGEDQLLKTESWYNSDVFDDATICSVTYADKSTNNLKTPHDVGEYKVTFELKGTKYSWAGGDKTQHKREVTYEIKPKTLRVDFHIDTTTGLPTLALASGESPYPVDTVSAGDFECVIRYFDPRTSADLGTDPSVLQKGLEYHAKAEFGGNRGKNYTPDDTSTLSFINPATRVTAKWQNAAQVYSGATRTFNLAVQGGGFTSELAGSYSADVQKLSDTRYQAVNAGRFGVQLTLTDKSECVWAETGRSDDIIVYFEVTPLEVVLNILSFSPADRAVTEGNKMRATIELPSIQDNVTLQLGAYWSGTLIENLCAINLSPATTHSEEFELATDNSSLSPDTYDLKLDVDDPSDVSAQNYRFRFDQDYTITIKEQSATGGINWRLMAGSQSAGYKSDPADSTSTTFDTTIYYDGRSYYFTVNASGIGYTVNTSYNDNGFINGYKTVAKGANVSLGEVKNAGEYITYVRLSKSGEQDAEYSISWKISKAIFDLTGVRWLQDGKITYKEGGISIVLDPDTLPAGLTPVYGGSHTATEAGQQGLASVTFQVADTNNYVVPQQSVSGSYIFNASGSLSDFEWSKQWEIVPAVIPVNWTNGTVTAGNQKVNAAVLAGGYDAYLDYVYYETDSMGNVLDPSAAPLTELVIIDGQVKYYVAEVSVKVGFAKGYILDPNASSYRSPVFEVGHTLTAVQIAPTKTSYIYWGNSVTFLFKVTQGAIAETAFDLVYYSGQTRLVNAPRDVGNYSVQITLKSAYLNQYYIDGTSTFQFTIERAIIAQNWDTGTKPPALKLNASEKACISYEYCDASGNPVSLAMMRTTPGNYSVRAYIKTSAQKNYAFESASGNDTFYTDWVSFTVNAGDTIIDPDTQAPSNPSVDPNDPNSSIDPSGKIKVTLTLLTASAEYNGNSQTAQFANSLNLPESAFIITYMQNGQVVTGMIAAGVYQIQVTLAPAYAEMYEISGASSFVFVITGGNGNGSTNPNDPNNPNNPDNIGGTPSDNTVEAWLPVILSGVSLVLIVVFGFMALNNASETKAAKKKARELAGLSYSVTYSVAPASLLLLFGLSQSNWWVIAGVLMGVALVMAIVMFMFRKKKIAALEILQEEQARIAEEKQYAEQQRRDDQMRMMFSALQQNQQPQQQQAALDYNSIQMMIASTVSALLPAGQPNMQALPPASGEPDDYRAQMQAQHDRLEAQIAAQQAQIAAQQEQMAQQQAMFGQMMQNQQAYFAGAYEEAAVADDVSWLGESDEVVSLEELYGNLNDDGKRCYYDVGSYIMNIPGTTQNDGKYAVLFKYRGRTLFKLCIKNGASVLYYPSADGKGKEEVRIDSPAALETAKVIIDRHIAGVNQKAG